MSEVEYHRRRQLLLDRFLAGSIDKTTYDQLLLEIERLNRQAPLDPVVEEDGATNTRPQSVGATGALAAFSSPSPAGLPTPEPLAAKPIHPTPHEGKPQNDPTHSTPTSDWIERPPLSSGTDLGKYRIEQLLSRGGMGEVWKGFDPIGDRWVAIKVLPLAMQESLEEIARFKTSFQRVQCLQHEHICPLYTLEHDTRVGYYLVMKFLEGMTLGRYRRQWPDTPGRLPLAVVTKLLLPVARALDYAHGKGIVHRDIKPENIMLMPDGTDVQVVDFGLAAEIHTSISRVSRAKSMEMEVSGTYPYMSPEQWRGHLQDGKTDQYALAVVAYELLTGRVPFEAREAVVIRQCALEEPVPMPIGQPESVVLALARGLEKDKRQRFDDCVALIAALEGVRATPVAPAAQRIAEELFAGITGAGTPATGRSENRVQVSDGGRPSPGAAPSLLGGKLPGPVSASKGRWSLFKQLPHLDKSPMSPAGNRGPHLPDFLEGHSDWVNALAGTPDGQWLVSGSSDGTVRLWDMTLASSARVLEWHRGPVMAVACAADGRRVASGSDAALTASPASGDSEGDRENAVILWDARAGRELQRFVGHTHGVLALAFSPGGGSRLLSASRDKTLRLWDTASGRLLRLFAGHEDWVSAVAFAPNGQWGASASRDSNVNTWDLLRMKPMKCLRGHGDWVRAVCITPDSQFLVSGGDDKNVRVWDTRRGEVVRILEGHEDWVYCVACTSDGRLVLTGGRDQTVRVWDLASGTNVACLRGHTGCVTALFVAPGTPWVASASADGSIRFWDLTPIYRTDV